MKRTSSGKFWIVSISACLISAGIVLACAGDWGPEYGTSSFTPAIIVPDSTYSPFFFSNNFYYGIGHDDNHDRRFNDANIREWSAWLGDQITAKELDFLLLHAQTASIDSMQRTARAKLPKLSAFLQYLKLAKLTETFALNNVTGGWEYEEKKNDRKKLDPGTTAAAIQKGMTDADPFLKQRYWFQQERNYFFNGTPKQAIDIFELHEKGYKHNRMYFRTMSYAAGAYYKQKNYAKANYYYARVYDSCPELRTVAHYSFHPQNETDWRGTLALCHTNEERCTLWQMLGIFYSDEGRAIGEIYKLDPGSAKMDLLLVRAINIYEQKFGASEQMSAPYSVRSVHDSANVALFKLVLRIAEEGKTARPWIWDMAAGYLHTLDAKYTAAQTWYARAAPLLPAAKLPQDQLRLLQLINKVGMGRPLDNRTENELRPEIEWLLTINGQAGNQEDNPALRSADALTWVKRKMAAACKKQKDPVRSECFVTTSNFYSDDKRVDALQAFLDKPAKTPFEQLCAGQSYIRSQDIYIYKAVRNAYAGRLDEAIRLLVLSGDSTVLRGNPFNGRIQDCHDCDHASAQNIKYTRLSFLQKLKDMTDKVASNTDTYTNCMLLGNAYYNMSHFGNARVFYECKVIGSDHAFSSSIDSIFRDMLTSMALGSSWYSRALKTAATDEQRAKCQYMLAKCERNDWYIANKMDEPYYGDRSTPDFIAWDGFAALKQYTGTQYYRDVLKECGYFRTYTEHKTNK